MMTIKLTTLLALAALGMCPAAVNAQYWGDPGLDPRVAATHQPPVPVLAPTCDHAPHSRFTLRGPPNLWPDGVVPFVIDPSVADPTLTLQAMEVWMFRSGAPNVTFVWRDPDDPAHASYINIIGVPGSVSSSPVGRVTSNPPGTVKQGEQVNTYVMAHELCHTLGWWHEQSRPDRDQYVAINLAYVPTESRHNFNMVAAGDWPANSLATPYDFDSVMHYFATAFVDSSCGTVNCAVLPCCSIIAQAPYLNYQCVMGQQTHLSVSDVQDVVAVYGARPRPLYFVGPGLGCTFPNSNFGTLILPYCNISQVPGAGDVRIRGGVTYNVAPGTQFTQPATWKKHGEGPVVISAQ